MLIPILFNAVEFKFESVFSSLKAIQVIYCRFGGSVKKAHLHCT